MLVWLPNLSERHSTGCHMKRFIEGQDRSQVSLLPECLDDFIGEDNTVRFVDAFVDELDLPGLGFDGTTPATTGRPCLSSQLKRPMDASLECGTTGASGSARRPVCLGDR